MKFSAFVMISLTVLMSSMAQAQTTLTAKKSEQALATLIENAASMTLDGDVSDDETLSSILASALLSKNVTVENECRYVGRSVIASCRLWLTSKPIGETVLQYQIVTPSMTVYTTRVLVSRGD